MEKQIDKSWIVILFLLFLLSCNIVHNNHAVITSKTVQDSAHTMAYYPLENENDLNVLINEMQGARIVLLGESTHGTHEFYTWRTSITKKLIEEKGFDFVAVEGDRTDTYKINQFIKAAKHDKQEVVEVLKQYDRWPASMWSNYEMADLLQWLNTYNQKNFHQIGLYGLDLYSFWEWAEQPVGIEDTAVQNAVEKLREFFSVYKNDAMKYADALRHSKPDGSLITKNLWNQVQKYFNGKQPKDENNFVLYQESWLVLNGERYFRTMITDHVKAINLRDAHMAQTIERLLNFYGPKSKAVIWVHNGHAGDTRYSDVSSSGYVNLAEILRNALSRKKIFSVGFGTYKGTVMAGYAWNGPVQKQIVLPAKEGSWEYLLHKSNSQNKIILSKNIMDNRALNNWIELRSIGAAYEGAAIYTRSIIPQRFDAFVFIDSTTAIHPITNLK
jgi:erythromycin esterase